MSQLMKVVEQGEVVFEEGSAGRTFYYIQSGSVEVSRGTGSGRQVVATLGKGQSFGEYALLKEGDSTRSATVTALERSLLVELDRESLEEILSEVPDFVNDLIRSLVNQVIELEGEE
ncbi:MAG: cyclic nucleotide-binding domain-containing protein [Candidatus Glassbacteria bacterium]|nr:cyclic nucleotide-binding domain-containing protein [Candidatus Glassbacteria bacterium]